MAVVEKTYGAKKFQEDAVATSRGPLLITSIGHGTLMFQWNGLVVHVDPVSAQARYEDMPKADVILLTHHHGDHMEPAIVELLRKADTEVVLTELCARQVSGGRVVRPGDRLALRGLEIETLFAYNIRHKRPDGAPFHPRGEGVGYVVSFGGLRVYVAGDTEDTPEMRALRSVDVAFLPMNLPYTMTPAMVADAVRAFQPGVLYPYHTGDTDLSRLPPLLAGLPGVEVRLRRLA